MTKAAVASSRGEADRALELWQKAGEIFRATGSSVPENIAFVEKRFLEPLRARATAPDRDDGHVDRNTITLVPGDDAAS